MHFYKINYKKAFLWIFIMTQIFLVVSYYYFEKPERLNFKSGRISFLNSENVKTPTDQTYHVEGDIIKVIKRNVRDKFMDFNSSLCFMNGTELNTMDRSKNSWACNCKNGWHGLECGQPEVVWRALLAYRKKLHVKGPRPFARRVLYIFKVDEFIENLIDMRINELNEVVDLFILIENNGNKVEKSLKNDFLKKYHSKILYLRNVSLQEVWYKITLSLTDLKSDDMILVSKTFEIPNKFVIGFLKYYDNWPEPISFRLRWSVFGFFWKHPNKTRTEGIVCTIKYMQRIFDSNFENLYHSKSNMNLIFGDLNHSGGWFCEYCMHPVQIIQFASGRSDIEIKNWKELKREKIDSRYIEALIENGLYIDGKTRLERSREYQDNYFAPSYVLDNRIKYDDLLMNVYNNFDYYEG